MKKLKIYIETSIISHLQAKDTPEKMNTTLKLWQEISDNLYRIAISEVTFIELERCAEPKRTAMFDFLSTKSHMKNLSLMKKLTLLLVSILKKVLSLKNVMRMRCILHLLPLLIAT